MLLQSLNLILIVFSTYLSAFFLRDYLGNLGLQNKISKLVVPLVVSILFFIIGAIYNINFALFALLPLILFSSEGGLFIISALFVSYLNPLVATLLIPPILYTCVKSEEKYSFIDLPILSYFIIPVSIAAIAISTYFLTLLPASAFAILLVPTTLIGLNLFEKKIDPSYAVLFSLSIALPLLALLKNEVYNPTLVSIGILFSLVPILRRPFWVQARKSS